MSTAATVPVLNPDTGNVHAIPTDQVDAARAAGGKPVATMRDPQGTKRYVPMDMVGEAQQHGGKLIPYGSQSSEEVVQDQTGIHPFTNPIGQTLAGAARGILSPITGAYGAVKSAFSEPTNDEENAAQAAGGPVGLLADRAIVQPARSAFRTARGLKDQGHPVLAAGAAMGALPVVGPMGQAAGQRAAAGDIPGAVAEGVTSALSPSALKEAGGAISSRFPSRAANTVVPGENYTPAHHQALSAALARGTGMGKDFFAPDVAADIASPARQAAADNPALAKAIQNGTPKDALGATQAVLKEAQNKVDTQHQAALKPVQNVPANMKPVQAAVPSPESFHDPSEVTQLNNLRNRAGKVQTLGDMNKFRQYLNEQTAPSFRQNAVAAGRSSVLDKALDDTLSATRDQYYQQLEDATGLDFQPAKRMESSLLKAQEALGNAAPNLVNKDAIANENQGKLAAGADFLEGGSKLKSGAIPGVGYLAEKMRGTPLDQLHRQLKTAFSDLPKQSVYNGPLAGQWQPAPKGLPGQTIGNADFSGAEDSGGTGQAVPPTVTPVPQQRPALPAVAGPEGAGIPPGRNISVTGTTQPPHGTIPLPARLDQPLLGSGEGNPEFVTPPASPPPPLNQPTAQTSVNAGRPMVRPIDRPVEEPPRPINIPRSLPAPETHAFSQKAWQAAHPNGNLKTAVKQAQAKGYRVVE